LHNYLGVEKYKHEVVKEKNQVGIATGLAWTVFGGEILFIEVNCMKGTGKLQLTGQLGDVMKESAMAGISYIRGNFSDFGIDEQFYKDTDIHIHVPEGAIPKDGPSAGITMATAVISALSGKPIRRDTAMTGEITLRGRVLPIGGIKEKVLAASEAGIKRIILPYENKKDMEEVPKNIKKRTQFIFVRSMDEVLKYSLLNKDDKNENK